MPPIYGQRAKPLEPLELDRHTVAGLQRHASGQIGGILGL